MKKIVILGGGNYQVPLIKAAKNQGYYVILCDFRENIPGKSLSDIHYQVDTLNFDEILSVCKKETPDGIVTNSEPAIINCTKVSNYLGLPSNSVDSITNLISKNLFRKIQKTAGCFSPKSYVSSDLNELLNNIDKFSYPIIIKPAESSGTRGTKKINLLDTSLIKNVFEECHKFSRNGLVEIEEFVEMPSLRTIEGEIFVHRSHILWDGLFLTCRSQDRPMLPMTYIAPLLIDEQQLNIIKQTIERTLNQAKITEGEFNIEGYFNKNGDFFIIEINARQGGLFLPDFVYRCTGIDFYRLLVTISVGDNSYWNELKGFTRHKIPVTNHAVFSIKNGLYDGLTIDNSIKKYVTNIREFKNQNEELRLTENATDVVALIELTFESSDEQYMLSNNLDKLIQPKYK